MLVPGGAIGAGGVGAVIDYKGVGPARPILRYHGGKWMLAPWIISHFPEHRTYVEPFGGAASVLLRKPRSYAEVYNDLADGIVNVFQVLRDSPGELERRLRLTPFSRTEFMATYAETPEDPIEWARQVIFRSMAGFGSASVTKGYKTGFRANSSRSGTTPALDWMHYPDNLKDFVERLRGVVIENRDYREVMLQHDSPETLHYCDPPYVHSTRGFGNPQDKGYEHEMTDAQHEQFAEVLQDLRGMVIVSGYRCDLYDRLFACWQRRERVAHADGARDRVEVLWLSPNIPAAPQELGL